MWKKKQPQHPASSIPTCRKCGRPVEASRELYDVFEHMHWVCFHLEFEHEGDPDIACSDPTCYKRLPEPNELKLTPQTEEDDWTEGFFGGSPLSDRALKEIRAGIRVLNDEEARTLVREVLFLRYVVRELLPLARRPETAEYIIVKLAENAVRPLPETAA